MKDNFITKHPRVLIGTIFIVLILAMTSVTSGDVSRREVQVLSENLELEEFHYYTLQNLKKGDTLYVYVEGISGPPQ